MAEQWETFSRDYPSEARGLRMRVCKSGVFNNIGTVLARTVAETSQIAVAGNDEYNESQWKDRMTARGASPDTAQRCWDDNVDMAGSSYGKKFLKRAWRMIVERPTSTLREKRVDEEKATEAHRSNLGRRSLSEAFAPQALGFATADDGSKRLRRSFQFDEMDLPSEDGDERARSD